MLSKVFTYCCHKKESIFCSKLIISKDGKHKETSALRSRQKKKKTLGISEMYECLFSCLFKHPQIFSQENREVLFFCPPEGKKKKAEMRAFISHGKEGYSGWSCVFRERIVFYLKGHCQNTKNYFTRKNESGFYLMFGMCGLNGIFDHHQNSFQF